MAGPFSFELARDVGRVFAQHGVRYVFIGKGGAIILGFPDTTQDVDLFPAKSPENCAALVRALEELGFGLTDQQRAEILRAKDFVQLRGPFLLDLVFGPDGIDRFEDAAARAIMVEGLPVAHIDDIIRSKEAADRVRDREALPRLRAFRDWWVLRQPRGPDLRSL